MRRAYRQPKMQSTTQGPFTGMRDSLAPTSETDGKAQLLQNAYPLNADVGAGVVGRPGFRQFGVQLGASGHRRVQGEVQFKKKDGTQYTVIVCGGKFYTLNWSTRLATEVQTAADFAAKSITLNPDARVSFVSLQDALAVHDGINTPFSWDGSTGGGTGTGLTKLTNVPVFYGPPSVYYAKQFGVKAIDRLTFDWSEENTLNTGYETLPYNNSWTFGQSDQSAITRVLGTNASLQVLRERSYASVTGAVDTQFATSGTRDGTSDTVGSKSPWSTVLHESRVFFVDADGRPRVRQLNAGVDDALWRDWAETIRQRVNVAALDQAIGVDYPACSSVLLAVPEIGATDPTLIFVIRVWEDGQEAAALWGWNAPFTALAMVLNGASQPTLLHGDANGFIYDHGDPNGTLWDDFLGTTTGAVPIAHKIVGSYHAHDTKIDKLFNRFDATVLSETMQNLDVSFITPYGQSILPDVLQTVGSGFQLDSTFFLDQSTLADVSSEQKVDAGLEAYGRWIQPVIAHERLGEQFGLLQYAIEYQQADTDPKAP